MRLLALFLLVASGTLAQSSTGGSHATTSSITVPDTSAISSVFRAPGPIHPYLPIATPNVTLPNTSGYTTLTATSASDLQTKVGTALAGCDNGGGSGATGYVISIAPGSVFTYASASGLLLTASTCVTSKIIVQTAGFSGARGTRIDPSTQVGTLASLRSTAAGGGVVTCNVNIPCGSVWFLGVELDCAATSGTCFNTWIPNNDTDTPADLPHDLTFDHVYAHNHASYTTTHCMLISGNNIAIVDSWISDCHSPSQDSQAFVCFSGGPYLVQNNFIEAAGENMICGGGNIGGVNVTYGINPHDMTSQHNWYYKPIQWFAANTGTVYEGIAWSVKNLYELKMCVRCLLQYSVLQNLWFPSAQTGGAVLQNGAISQNSFFGIQSDVSYFYNHFIGGTHWLESNAVDAGVNVQTNSYRLEMTNNLLEDMGTNWGTSSFLTKQAYIYGMIINHNTSTTTSTVGGTEITSIFNRTGPYYFSNNIIQHGTSGFAISGFASDSIASLNIALGAVQAPYILNNALQGMASGTVTTWNADATGHYVGTSGPAAMTNIGFVNAASAGGDYRLCTGVNAPSAPCAAASPYLSGGANGCQVNADGTGANANCGADIATILTQTAGIQTVPTLWPDSLSGGGISVSPTSLTCNNSNTVTVTPIAGSNGGSAFVLNGMDVVFRGTAVTPGSVSTSSITFTPPTVSGAATITNTSLTSNLATYTATNNYRAGDLVTITGLSNNPAVYNVTGALVVGSNGSIFTVAITHANISSGADSGTAAGSAAVTVSNFGLPLTAALTCN